MCGVVLDKRACVYVNCVYKIRTRLSVCGCGGSRCRIVLRLCSTNGRVSVEFRACEHLLPHTKRAWENGWISGPVLLTMVTTTVDDHHHHRRRCVVDGI